MAVRPLHGDPLGVRLLLAARTQEELDAVYPELEEAYEEVALQAPGYREWLETTGKPPNKWGRPSGEGRPMHVHART